MALVRPAQRRTRRNCRSANSKFEASADEGGILWDTVLTDHIYDRACSPSQICFRTTEEKLKIQEAELTCRAPRADEKVFRLSLILPVLTILATGIALADTPNNVRLCHASAVKTPDKAVDYCSEAIREGGLPTNEAARLFNSRGIAHQALRDYSAAIQDYDQALRINPSYPEALNNRGTAFHSKGIYDRAIQDYTASIKLDHTNPITFRSRGITHFCLGHFDDAEKDLKLAIDLDPSDTFSAIWLYLSQARRDGVSSVNLSTLASRLKLGEWPGPVVRLFAGTLEPKDFLTSLDGPDAGSDAFRRCEALFFLGEFSLLNGDRDKAMQYFRSAVETRLTDDFEYTSALSEMQRLKSP